MNDLKKIAIEFIDQNKAEIGNLSHEIFTHPELAMKEFFAHDLLANYLEKMHFKVERQFCIPTAFKATVQNGAGKLPHIVFMSEYDALPDIGHACGHNLIATSSIAAAIAVKRVVEVQNVPAKISLYGTPAEEAIGGKIKLIEQAAFKDVDVAIMSHPNMDANTIYKPHFAIESIKITFHGKASHASVQPWEGKNALDAAVLAYQSISVLRQQMNPSCQIHGIITNGGQAPNIIPELTEMVYLLRATQFELIDKLKKQVGNCLEAAALATGCTVNVTTMFSYQNIKSNETLRELYRNNAEVFGVNLNENAEKQCAGSTDAGNVSQVVPTIQPMFVIGDESMIGKYPLHSQAFTSVAGSKEAQTYSIRQAKVMACLAIDILTKEENMIEKIWEDFKKK